MSTLSLLTRQVTIKRCFSDIVRLPNVKRGVLKIRYGHGGRSSTSNLNVTVFGCTGFLGNYVVNRLGQLGVLVITPWRGEEDSKRHLKPMGDLGQINSLHYDIYNQRELIECVRHSDVVINLIGRDYATKNYTIMNSNVDSARNIAHVCREEGVSHLIHVSHLSANQHSPSIYLQAKALSELAIRDEFPSATIIRSATMFGHEDRFLHQIGWYAGFPAIPLVNEGKTIRRPVYVGDVATGIANIVFDHRSSGKTYEFYGPKAYTYDEVVDLWLELTRKTVSKVYPSQTIMQALAKIVDTISPYPQLHPDNVARMMIDEHPQLVNVSTLADAGVLSPKILEYAAVEYVRRYRKHDDYHLPGRVPISGNEYH